MTEPVSAEMAGDNSVRPGPASVLRLRPLRVTDQGDGEFLVGDPAQGEFVALPEIAIVVLDEIGRGRSLAEVAEVARTHAGEDVDVLDFTSTLLDLGFVTRVDGVPVGDGPDAEEPARLDGPLVALLVRLARPLYSVPALVLGALLFLACAGVLLGDPRYRPRAADLYSIGNPVTSIAVLTVISMVLTAGHEVAHWLGARVQGLPATITVGRRLYLLVLETDLTALWAVPRRRRWGALLGGIGFDTVVIAALLGLRIAANAGLWHPAPMVAALIAGTITARVLSVITQFLVFLRTDIYAALVTGLGCLNLSRVNQLAVREMLHRLSPDDRAELAGAAPRDLRVARWYRWLYAAGMVWAAWAFAWYVVPSTVEVVRWTAVSLAITSPTHLAFWEALAFGLTAVLPTCWVGVLYLRERLAARR